MIGSQKDIHKHIFILSSSVVMLSFAPNIPIIANAAKHTSIQNQGHKIFVLPIVVDVMKRLFLLISVDISRNKIFLYHQWSLLRHRVA